MDIISVFVREQRRYTREELSRLFRLNDKEVAVFIQKLKAYGVLKAVKRDRSQADLSELLDEDIEIVDDAGQRTGYFYVFTYVGVLTVGKRVIKCFPKYILSEENPLREMQQVLAVLQRFAAEEQIISLYIGDEMNSSFNPLSVMLFLLNDYHDTGLYTNSEDIVSLNGEGSILWEQTIARGFAIIKEKQPFYVDLFTRRTTNDEDDFFFRLHKSVLTECTVQLKETGLLDLFFLLPAELSDEPIDSFGDRDYLLQRIEAELNIQFNTHQQLQLKALYAYIANRQALTDEDGISMYGTTSFHSIWEKVCAAVFDSQLRSPLGSLPIPLLPTDDPTITLLQVIAPPVWYGLKQDGSNYAKPARETLEPDLIRVYAQPTPTFVIFDAKYYCIRLEEGSPIQNQPGVGDVTKQYLYQLAYKEFLSAHGITNVKNCFLLPTEQNSVICKGWVAMKMLDDQELQNIQIRLLPAAEIYDCFLSQRTLDYQYLQI